MIKMHVRTSLITNALQHVSEWSHSKSSRNTILTIPSSFLTAVLSPPLCSSHVPPLGLQKGAAATVLCSLRALGHTGSKQQHGFYWVGKRPSFCSLPQCSSASQAFGFPSASGRWGRAQTRWCCCHCSHGMQSRTSGQSWSSAPSLSHAGASQWAPLSTHLWGLAHGPKSTGEQATLSIYYKYIL